MRGCNAIFTWFIFHSYSTRCLYFFANEIFIACVGVILKPCSASLAALLCSSVANSTNAMSCRLGTRRTSLKPGNWLNSMDSIISFVSSGKLVRNRIWLGGCSAGLVMAAVPNSAPAADAFFFLFSLWTMVGEFNTDNAFECVVRAYRFSSDTTGFGALTFFGRSLNVPLILATRSLSPFAYAMRIGLS